MANLFVCTDYYISDITSDDTAYNVNTHLLTNEGEYQESKDYAFEKESFYANSASVGTVTETEIFSHPWYTAANVGTYSIGQNSTTGSGTGFSCDLTIDDDYFATVVITSGGSGYNIDDSIEFTHADSRTQNTDVIPLTIKVTNSDEYGIELFPTGLTDAEVLANALPLINSIISTSSE